MLVINHETDRHKHLINMVCNVMKRKKKFTSILGLLVCYLPITVAVRSNACTVFARSNAGIVGSNPTQGMDVCMSLFCK
jgi:hypothetical protein